MVTVDTFPAVGADAGVVATVGLALAVRKPSAGTFSVGRMPRRVVTTRRVPTVVMDPAGCAVARAELAGAVLAAVDFAKEVAIAEDVPVGAQQRAAKNHIDPA